MLNDYFKMDINIAYSIINMKLRDKYPDLQELCYMEDIDEEKLLNHFADNGYIYDISKNQFVLK